MASPPETIPINIPFLVKGPPLSPWQRSIREYYQLYWHLHNTRLYGVLLHKSSFPCQQNSSHVVLHISQSQQFQPKMFEWEGICGIFCVIPLESYTARGLRALGLLLAYGIPTDFLAQNRRNTYFIIYRSGIGFNDNDLNFMKFVIIHALGKAENVCAKIIYISLSPTCSKTE